MSAPVVSAWATELYGDLPTSFVTKDAANGYALLLLTDAVASMFQPIADLARDTDADEPGWSSVVDVDRAPTDALAYLAQFAGVQLLGTLSDTDQRLRIRAAAGRNRGTLASIRAAVQPTLTGNRTVIVRERFDPSNPSIDSAYHLQVTTYTAETPNSAKAQAAALAAKPAGLVMHFQTVTGEDWQSVANNETDWADNASDFATWQGVADALPGT